MIRILILFITISVIVQSPQVTAETHQPEMSRLEKFLADQFDRNSGLVRESPDNTINRTYWLLSDNLVAAHVLRTNYPDIAVSINASLHEYGVFEDGLHEALFGGVIRIPPYTPIVGTVHQDPLILVEERSNATGSLQNDWTLYADLLTYGALSSYNAGHFDDAVYYFSRVKEMWNEAGVWDKPTQLDGFYTTHKLALLMYAADLLNQTLPFRDILEQRIWMFQREDGGIRSHYLGNLTSNREANSETAGLVLLAYQYAQQKAEREQSLLKEQENQRIFQQNLMIAVAGAAIAVGLASFLIRKRRKG
jgi:hypothetical protein